MTDDDAGDVVYDLSPDCTPEDVEEGERYLATVNGIVDYGAFVDLSDAVSGLVHESELDRTLSVGDELVVKLDAVRENGDLAFVPVDAGDYSVETRAHEYEATGPTEVASAVESTVHLEGEIVQIRQTGGPTVFSVQAVDEAGTETGVVPCAAFEGAGVRAYPDVELGEVVRVTGRIERRESALQVETDELVALDGDAEADVRRRLDDAVEALAEPADVDPLVSWDALEKLLPELRDLARRLRRTVVESRPIRIRHHADGDGMAAAVPVELALRRFVREVHERPDSTDHLLKRSPSKAPFYDMEDATRDLNYALEDRARHGQKLPLLLMLDNGSTEEDTPGYRNLAHYDISIAVVDHHHPDPEAVAPLLDAHVNPYLHDEDYRVTTGMLSVELARMIHPDVTDELRHVPSVAGLSDRSDAEAMPDYLKLAREAGYEEATLRNISEALDYAAYLLRYDPGRGFVNDLLNVGTDDEDRHRELVEFLSTSSESAVEEQLDVALAHLERESLSNGADLYRIDVENHAHRFTYPAPGKTTGAVHDAMLDRDGGPAITIGYGPDFAVLRSDGVRLDIPEMVAELQAELPGAGVSGGGHLVVGSIKFVEGRREEVLDALVGKMAEAELDEDLATRSPYEDPVD
ncbi:MAG: S1 RNA-binding domain-containing protein [Halobacteriales archaeon]